MSADVEASEDMASRNKGNTSCMRSVEIDVIQSLFELRACLRRSGNEFKIPCLVKLSTLLHWLPGYSCGFLEGLIPVVYQTSKVSSYGMVHWWLFNGCVTIMNQFENNQCELPWLWRP